MQDTFASGARVPYLPNSARWRSYKKPTISPDPAETPNKRHPQNSLGCKIINTSPAHAHCNLRVALGHRCAYYACAVPLSFRAQDRKNGPRGPTKKKDGSAAAARSRSPCFLPHSASWLPYTAAAAPAAAAVYLLETQHRSVKRSRPQGETKRSFTSAPPLSGVFDQSALRAPTFATAPRDRPEPGLAALAKGLTNQFAGPIQGAERGHHRGEELRALFSAPVVSLWKPRDATVTLRRRAGARS